jgi:poly(3-hydroxybutyrate) depolymerase
VARIDHLPEQHLASVTPVRHRRRRAAWIAATAIALGSAAAFVVPALASAGTDTPAAPTAGGHVLVCTSGVVQQGDIQTSSASATRVAEGDTTPPPAGCELK